MTAKNNEKRVMIYWDDASIESEAGLFPAQLQAAYLWLKTFVRDTCGKDVDALVVRALKCGVTTDKTNWVRILKGRWMHDADGNELANPYVSAQNLAMYIQAIRENVRVELLRGGTPFVETTTFETIRRFVEKKLRKDRVNRFGVILGPTGTQKTASFKELSARTPGLKWIESTDNGSMKEFIRLLAVKCGAPRSASYNHARSIIFDAMSVSASGAPKGVIVDNMQDMVRSDKTLTAMGKSTDTQPAYQFMRRLQEETGCSVIWSITPENEDQMFNPRSIYLEQFEGRAGGRDGFLRLPNFPPRKDLVQIAEVYGFKNAEKHSDLLLAIAKERGRIRRFFEILQEAKDQTESGLITAEHLQAALDERVQAEPARRDK